MSTRVRGVLASLLVLVTLSSPLLAQYSPGDILVPVDQGNARVVLGVTPSGTVFTASPTRPMVAGPRTVLPSIDNRTTWMASWGFGLFSLSPSGVWTTVSGFFPFSPAEVDETGLLLGMSASSDIMAVDQLGQVSTLASYSFLPVNSFQLDRTSGAMFADNGGNLLRLSTRSPSVITTLTSTTVAFAFQPTWCPGEGAMIGPGLATLAKVKLSAPFTRTFYLMPSTLVIAAERSPHRDTVLVVYEDSTPDRWLVEVNPRDGTILRTLLKANIQDVCVANSRHLVGGTVPARGQVWTMLVSFPAFPGASYATVASFGLGPGVPVGNGLRVYLQPDALTALSLSGSGVFQAFHGVLDATGEAGPSIRIPNIAGIRGTRFFVSSLVIGPRGVARVSDPVGVTIR